jgi:ParB family chromosome partitioning protein
MPLGKGLSSLIPSKQPGSAAPAVQHSSTGAPGTVGKTTETVWNIPLSEIKVGASQPRKHFEEAALKELADSIRQHGVVQPVVVTELLGGAYELIAGERRLRATKLAGLATIPALVKKMEERQKLEVALIENIQRENLNPLEEAFAYKRLMEEFSLSLMDIGKRVGKAQSTVSNAMRLLSLPGYVQEALVTGEITMGHARALLGLKDEASIKDAFDSMRGKKMSVRDVERAVLTRKTRTHGTVNRDPLLFSYEEALRSSLGTKVNITKKKSKGTILISYYSDEELKRLVAQLKKA